MQRRCWQRPWPRLRRRRRVACGMWQVAALAVPLSPLQLSLLPSLLLFLLLLWHCLAIYQRTQTYTLPPPTLVIPPLQPHCHPGPNRWFIALLFRRWCRAFCCSAFLFIASAIWTIRRIRPLWSVLILFSFSSTSPLPPSSLSLTLFSGISGSGLSNFHFDFHFCFSFTIFLQFR